MPLTIAAIRSGTEPQGPLPEGAFQRTLDDAIVCPKCDATYSLIADYEESTSRQFDDRSRPLILMLRKAVFLGHGDGHRASHFETSGVTVRRIVADPATPSG